jgi:4-alpha-glucanotransferase
MTTLTRSSGIILHPTSLPGPDGIGDLGPEAYRWVDFLHQCGCSIWQVLPIGPTGYGDSPYQCFSAFAGNPFLISPTLLLDAGLLTPQDLAQRPEFPSDHVDYGPVIGWKLSLLDKAFERFNHRPRKKMTEDFAQFERNQKSWLLDFATFMAIKESLGGIAWGEWPESLRLRDKAAIKDFSRAHAVDLRRHAFRQFLFHEQWTHLKQYANHKGIRIMGDMPLYVAYDSSDCWSHPNLFSVNKQGQLTIVAGVPPDYFSPTGQRWGNPLYRWQVHEENGFAWWIERTRSALSLFDFVRIDHFRGFAAYWEVKASAPTAEKGSWVKGPGTKFFNALAKAIKPLPIIAEDLGVITADVVTLRDEFNLPGMKILQFAFDGPDNPFLPTHYSRNCVAYTGTHDNDTTLGWYRSAPPEEQDFGCGLCHGTPSGSVGIGYVCAYELSQSAIRQLVVAFQSRYDQPGTDRANEGNEHAIQPD